MNHGILSTVLATLAWSGLALGCRPAADPAQLKALDSMITNTEAASLTLDELDHGRYLRADSLFRTLQQRFADKFRDTLGREEALLLGNHYLVLRAARTMGNDHLALRSTLEATAVRLRDLRRDLESGSMDQEQGAAAIARERLLMQDVEADVHRALDNYRTVQRAWEERTMVEPLIAQDHDHIPERP